MRLACALTAAGGACNEDDLGFIGTVDDVSAAWVIDGVTGINENNLLPAATDARWFVDRVQAHLPVVLEAERPLLDMLQQLVARLIADWLAIVETVNLPPDYDLPACCLLLVRKTLSGWQALRLGDSFLLSTGDGVHHHPAPASNLSNLEEFLKAEARKRRASGNTDFKTLLTEFRPQLMQNRRSRNTPGGYSILEPTRRTLVMPQIMDIRKPSQLLLCTDGFYRSVDHYDMYDDASLLAACESQKAAEDVLRTMRRLEHEDHDCSRFLRFKPQDDATVLKLTV